MKKLAFLFAVVFFISLPLNVSATTWTLHATPVLSFSGTTATCKATVVGDNTSQHIEVTMKLMYGTTIIASWSDDGYGYVYMSKTAGVTSGRTYRLQVEITVDGTEKDPLYTSGTC